MSLCIKPLIKCPCREQNTTADPNMDLLFANLTFVVQWAIPQNVALVWLLGQEMIYLQLFSPSIFSGYGVIQE